MTEPNITNPNAHAKDSATPTDPSATQPPTDAGSNGDGHHAGDCDAVGGKNHDQQPSSTGTAAASTGAGGNGQPAGQAPEPGRNGTPEAATDHAGEAHRRALEAGQECLDAGLYYLSRGWSVLAVCPPNHVGVGKAHGKHCQSPGKAPWGQWKEFQDRLPTEEELRRKWQDNPQLNVGIALGPVSGLIRVDVDGPGGEHRLQELSGGDVPPTLEFKSGRADGTGRGLLYRIPPGAKLRTTSESHGTKQELRLQARGAQTVLPPSRHKDGGRYAWREEHGPEEIEAAPAPTWLLSALSAPTAEATSHAGTTPLTGSERGSIIERAKQYLATLPEAIQGQNGSARAMRAACVLVEGFSLSETDALALLRDEYNPRCKPPWSENELWHKVEDAIKKIKRPGYMLTDAERPHLTDTGNAKRMIHDHGRDLRHCHPWKKWLVWDGCRWQLDATAAVTTRAKRTIAGLFRWAETQVAKIREQIEQEECDYDNGNE
jgi:hypothetical protein